MDVKRYAFWIGMGGVGLVLLLFYVMFVVSAQSQASALQTNLLTQKQQLSNLQNKGADLPNAEWAKVFADHKKSLEAQRDAVKKFYKDEGDPFLETWFDELKTKVPQGSQPTLGDFLAQYKDNMDRLVKYLEAKSIQVGAKKGRLGGESEGGFEIRVKDVNDNNMRGLQKHYWIQKRLADVMVQSNVAVFEKIDFKDDITRRDEGPGAGGVPGAAALPRDVSPTSLPLSLGQSIPFELTVHLKYSDVPLLLANFLKFETKSLPLMTRIRSFKIRKTQTPKEVERVEVNVNELNKPEHKKKVVEPIPVKVVLVGEVLDFEIQ